MPALLDFRAMGHNLLRRVQQKVRKLRHPAFLFAAAAAAMTVASIMGPPALAKAPGAARSEAAQFYIYKDHVFHAAQAKADGDYWLPDIRETIKAGSTGLYRLERRGYVLVEGSYQPSGISSATYYPINLEWQSKPKPAGPINLAGMKLLDTIESPGPHCTKTVCHAYQDVNGQLLIGYAHQLKPGEPEVMSRKEVEALKIKDLSACHDWIKHHARHPLNENQSAVFVIFCYNIGLGGLIRSSVWRVFQEGRYFEVPRALSGYTAVTIDGERVHWDPLEKIRNWEINLWKKQPAPERRMIDPPLPIYAGMAPFV